MGRHQARSAIVPTAPPLAVRQLQAKPVDPVRNPANLAARSLLRGMTTELPNGQAVADAMGRRIVAELIGLLAADGRSFLLQSPNWQP